MFARSARFGRDSNSSFGRSFGEYAAPYFRDSRIQVARRQNRFGLVPRWIKFLIAGVALALAAVPATFIVTLLLYPFWSWVEATYRIESVGHSGPADWCFIVVYGVFLVLLLLLLWCGWRHRVIRSQLPRRAAKGMPAVPPRTIALKRTSMQQRMEW